MTRICSSGYSGRSTLAIEGKISSRPRATRSATSGSASRSARSASERQVATVRSIPRRSASRMILRIVSATPFTSKNVSVTSRSFSACRRSKAWRTSRESSLSVLWCA